MHAMLPVTTRTKTFDHHAAAPASPASPQQGDGAADNPTYRLKLAAIAIALPPGTPEIGASRRRARIRISRKVRQDQDTNLAPGALA